MLARDPPLTRAPARWTRVADDTGGGHSLTHFEILYFEGEPAEAFAAIFNLFGVERDASTPEYGACLSASIHPSFEAASWFERGADWDRAARTPIERARWERQPLVSASDWAARCEIDIERAVAHSKDWNASRHGKMLALDRASTLAAARGGMDLPLADEARLAEELLELALGAAPGRPNAGLLRSAAASTWNMAIERTYLCGMQPTDEGRAWTSLFDRLDGSDYEALRARCAEPSSLEALDGGLMLALTIPASRALPSFDRFALPLSDASLDRVARMARAHALLPADASLLKSKEQGDELVARVESLMISRQALPAQASRAAARL